MPQSLSKTVYAVSHPKLFKKVADHIVALDSLDEFWPRAISNTVWAYAKAAEQHPKLLKKFADHIIQLDNLDIFKPQDLVNTVWAYAVEKESHPMLFKKLADAAITRQVEFNSQDVATFLWAYATNGVLDGHLFSAFQPSVKANLDKWGYSWHFSHSESKLGQMQTT